MVRERCQRKATFSDMIIGLKKLSDSNAMMPSQSAKTKPQYLNDIVFYLQHLSVEELWRIAEAQSIESQLEKVLQRKIRRKLLEQVSRNNEDIRRL